MFIVGLSCVRSASHNWGPEYKVYILKVRSFKRDVSQNIIIFYGYQQKERTQSLTLVWGGLEVSLGILYLTQTGGSWIRRGT